MTYTALIGAVSQIAAARAQKTLRSLAQAASGTCQKASETFGKCVKGISFHRCLDCATLAMGGYTAYNLRDQSPQLSDWVMRATFFAACYAFSPRFRDRVRNVSCALAGVVDRQVIDRAPAVVQKRVRRGSF